MKTAISIPDNLFKEVERFAQEQDCSRSQVFAIAVKELMEKARARELLKSLNKAYSEDETEEDKAVRRKAKSYYASKVLKERY
jgi:metal-responsive CopG/Arc/MetJ family transcriptional regulator